MYFFFLKPVINYYYLKKIDFNIYFLHFYFKKFRLVIGVLALFVQAMLSKVSSSTVSATWELLLYYKDNFKVVWVWNWTLLIPANVTNLKINFTWKARTWSDSSRYSKIKFTDLSDGSTIYETTNLDGEQNITYTKWAKYWIIRLLLVATYSSSFYAEVSNLKIYATSFNLSKKYNYNWIPKEIKTIWDKTSINIFWVTNYWIKEITPDKETITNFELSNNNWDRGIYVPENWLVKLYSTASSFNFELTRNWTTIQLLNGSYADRYVVFNALKWDIITSYNGSWNNAVVINYNQM